MEREDRMRRDAMKTTDYVITTSTRDGSRSWKVKYQDADAALGMVAEALRAGLVVVAVDVRA